MSDDNFFEGLEEEEIDATELYGAFLCSHCRAKIPFEYTMQRYLAIGFAKDENPSWRFYENATFCSASCETAFLSLHPDFNLTLFLPN